MISEKKEKVKGKKKESDEMLAKLAQKEGVGLITLNIPPYLRIKDMLDYLQSEISMSLNIQNDAEMNIIVKNLMTAYTLTRALTQLRKAKRFGFRIFVETENDYWVYFSKDDGMLFKVDNHFDVSDKIKDKLEVLPITSK